MIDMHDEIFQVRSLRQSFRGKYPYFGDTWLTELVVDKQTVVVLSVCKICVTTSVTLQVCIHAIH